MISEFRILDGSRVRRGFRQRIVTDRGLRIVGDVLGCRWFCNRNLPHAQGKVSDEARPGCFVDPGQ